MRRQPEVRDRLLEPRVIPQDPAMSRIGITSVWRFGEPPALAHQPSARARPTGTDVAEHTARLWAQALTASRCRHGVTCSWTRSRPPQ
jgi:hypothetical protein